MNRLSTAKGIGLAGKAPLLRVTTVLVACLVWAPSHAAPLVLYDPAGASALSPTTPSAAFTSTAPALSPPVACGGFGAPCGFLATPVLPAHSFTLGGQKFDWGGSVSTGVGFANHATATDIGVSAWVKSQDSSLGLFIAVDNETLRALQGFPAPAGSFGRK